MKHLYLIGGTMGIGKTTVCQILKEKLDRSVFLDGDWCWDMHPFTVTEETKRMVMENITFLLRQFLRCSEIENVLFCWVMHEQSIIDDVLSRLPKGDFQVFSCSLICDQDTLIRRIQKDIDKGIRTRDVIQRALERLTHYEKLDTVKISVSHLSPEETAKEILNQAGASLLL